jgi:hypothetical protein
MASTISTTSDLRLPLPKRISERLPQPEAMVIPTPNRKPPTVLDSHSRLGVA